MPIRKTWRVRCTTETAYVTEERWTEEGPPTQCPNDAGHTIVSQVTAIVAEDRNVPDARDPSVDDDDSREYVVGDRWTNGSTGAEFVCTDTTDGAAVWQKTSEGEVQGVNYDTVYADNSISTSNTNSWTQAFTSYPNPPFDGDYYCIFELTLTGSGNNGEIEIGIALNSNTTPLADTIRPRQASNDEGSLMVSTVLTGLVTTDEVHGLFRKSTGNGSVTVHKRRLSIFRMG